MATTRKRTTRKTSPPKPKAKDDHTPSAVEAAMPDANVGAPEKPQRRWIISSTKIDSKNVLRRRVLITPAICEKCGFDFLYTNKLPAWDQLNEREQDKVREALEAHDAAAHQVENQLIITDDEKPTQWLGEKNEARRRLLA